MGVDLDTIRAFLNASSKQEILTAVIGIEAMVAFAFVICSFAVASTANAGFNAVLTGLLDIGYVVGSYYVIKKSKAPIAIGFLIGSGGMMAMLNFMTAIYWGQLSWCESVTTTVSHYSCANRFSYSAVSFFAVGLFLLQGGFTAAVAMWRGELMSETGGYDEISAHSSHSNPYESNSAAFASSADL